MGALTLNYLSFMHLACSMLHFCYRAPPILEVTSVLFVNISGQLPLEAIPSFMQRAPVLLVTFSNQPIFPYCA